MKRVFLSSALALLVVLCGFCLYMEVHFSTTAYVAVEMSQEELLSEMPEAALTPEDDALRDALLALPEVQQGLDDTRLDGAVADLWKASPQRPAWLPAGRAVSHLTAMGGNQVFLSLSFDDEPSRLVDYCFYTAADTPTEKVVSLYERTADNQQTLKALYANHLGTLTKSVPRRQWFSWVNRWLET